MASTKFQKGDEVKVVLTGKVEYIGSDYIEFRNTNGDYLGASTKYAVVTKAVTPPTPKPGTVIDVSYGYAADRFLVGKGGELFYISRTTGKPDDYSTQTWGGLNHRDYSVTIVG